jgi:hypothetical protein
MNESVMIIGITVLTLLAGAYAVWYFGQYLYELYVEYFTTDPDPDHPEVPQKPKLDFYERADKIMNIIPNIAKKVNGITENVIRGIQKWSEEQQKNKKIPTGRTRVNRPKPPKRDPNAYRSGYLKDPVDGIWKPTRVVNNRTRQQKEDDYLRQREENLGIRPDQVGRGRDHWDTRDFPKEKPKPRRRPKPEVWDTGLYEGGDQFTRGRRRTTGNTGPK